MAGVLGMYESPTNEWHRGDLPLDDSSQPGVQQQGRAVGQPQLQRRGFEGRIVGGEEGVACPGAWVQEEGQAGCVDEVEGGGQEGPIRVRQDAAHNDSGSSAGRSRSRRSGKCQRGAGD